MIESKEKQTSSLSRAALQYAAQTYLRPTDRDVVLAQLNQDQFMSAQKLIRTRVEQRLLLNAVSFGDWKECLAVLDGKRSFEPSRRIAA